MSGYGMRGDGSDELAPDPRCVPAPGARAAPPLTPASIRGAPIEP